MSLRRAAFLGVLCGVALGGLSRGSDLLPRELGWIGNLGGLWLAVAFTVGAKVRRPAVAASAGAGTLVLAALVHYGSMRIVRSGTAGLLGYPAPQWAAVGTVAGGLFGAIGSLWSDGGRRPVSVAILSAALGAEALYLLSAHEPNARPVALPVEIAAFLMLPLVSLEKVSERMRTYGWSLALAPPGAAAIAAAVAIAHRVY